MITITVKLITGINTAGKITPRLPSPDPSVKSTLLEEEPYSPASTEKEVKWGVGALKVGGGAGGVGELRTRTGRIVWMVRVSIPSQFVLLPPTNTIDALRDLCC